MNLLVGVQYDLWPWLSPSRSLRVRGAHGKPVAQSPYQIRLLTSGDERVAGVIKRQLGEERRVKQSKLLIGYYWKNKHGAWKGQRLFFKPEAWTVLAWGMFQRCICGTVGSAEFQMWHLISGWFEEGRLLNLFLYRSKNRSVDRCGVCDVCRYWILQEDQINQHQQ